MNRKTSRPGTDLPRKVYEQRIANLEKELGLARKRLEERNRDADLFSGELRLFKRYFDAYPAMICHLSPAGRILDVNRTLVERMGLEDKRTLIGRSVFMHIFSSGCRSRARRVFKEWQRTGKIENGELRIRSGNGACIDVLTHMAFLRDRKNRSSSVFCTLVDITETGKTAGRPARARHLIEQSPTVVFLWKNTGGWPVQYVTPNVRAVFGYSVEDFEQGNVDYTGIIHPDDLERVAAEVNEAGNRKDCRFFVHEPYRARKADGTHIWLDDRTTVVRNEKGRVTHYQGMVMDVSDSVTREQALKRVRERYRTIFEGSRDGFVMVSPDGRITDANPAYCDMLGYSLPELRRKRNFYSITPKKWHAWEEKEIWRNRLLKKGFSGIYEKEYIHKSGRVFPVELQSYCVLDANGKPEYLWGIARDITERKKKETQLHNNRFLLAKAQEMGRIGTWELDIVNNVLTWTEENYRIFGVKPGTPLTYEIFLGCIHPDDREYVNREWTARMKTNDYDIEHRLVVKGKTRWVREKADITFDKKGKPVRAIGFTQDITDRKLAEVELRISETRFRNLFRNSPFGIVICEGVISKSGALTDFIHVQANEATTVQTGFEIKELVGRKASELVSRKELKWLTEKYAPCLMAGKTVNYIRRFDIYDKILEVTAYPAAGNRFILSFIDITDRKAAEERIRKQSGLLNEMGAMTKVGGWEMDLVARTAEWTSETYKIVGLEKDAPVPGPDEHVSYYLPQYRTMIRKAMNDLTRKGVPLDFTAELKTPGGTVKWCRAIGRQSEWDSRGKCIRISGSFQDITDRKNAELALTREHDRAQQYLDVAGTMFVAIDTRGRVTMVNRKACDILGYEEDEIVGKSWFANFLPHRIRKDVRIISRSILDGSIKGNEYVEGLVLCRNGSERLIGWYNTILYDKSGNVTGHLSSGQDITEIRKAEEEIRNLARFPEENPSPVVRVGTGGNVLYANTAGRILLKGMARTGGALKKTYREAVTEALAAGKSKVIDVAVEKKLFSAVFAPVPEPGYVNIYAQDITERKRMEEERRAAAAVWQETFDAMHSGIMFVSTTGIILKVNRAAASLTGMRPDDMVGLPCRDVMHYADEVPADCFLEEIKKKPRHLSAIRHWRGRWLRLEGDPVTAEDGHLIGLVHIMTDITDQTLDRMSLERYRQAVEASSDMAVVLSPSFEMLTANSAFLRFFRLSRKDIHTRRLRDIFGRRLFARSIGPDLAAALEGRVFSRMLDLTFDGTGKRVLYFRYYPFRNDDGQVEGIALSIADVTDRVHTERALENSERKFRSIIENAGLGIVVITPDGSVQDANPAFCAMTGWPADTLKGEKHPFRFWDPAVAAELQERHRLLLFRGSMEYETRFQTADARDFPVRIVASPILDNRNKAVAFIHIVQNISDQYRMLRRLQESERRYRVLVEDMPVMVCRFTADGRIEFANSAYLEFYGLRSDQVVGAHWLDLVPEGERHAVEERLERLNVRNPIMSHEQTVKDKDGLYHWFRWIDRVITDDEGRAREYQSVGMDITERKADEQKLLDMSRQLRRLSTHLQTVREEERAFLARELHDELGQQLTALKMDIAYLDQKCRPASDKVAAKLADMQKMVNTTIRTVKQLSVDLRPGVLDDLGIPAALEWLMDDFRTRAEIDCAIAVQPGVVSPGKDTSVALFRILQEALTNVGRHAAATRVRVKLFTTAGMLILEISDNGTGIPERKADDAASFGLVGMRERAMALNGLLFISTPAGGGTLIRVSLPADKADSGGPEDGRTDG